MIPEGRPTLIFASTRHHVDLLAQLLAREGISATYVYGTLDQVALSTPLFACSLIDTCQVDCWPSCLAWEGISATYVYGNLDQVAHYTPFRSPFLSSL